MRTTKEFDEIRLLCSENDISDEIAEEFIKGDRLLLVENIQKEPVDKDYVQVGTATLKDIVSGIPKPTEDEIKAAEKERRAPVVYTVEDVKKKLGEELKIYKDGDSKYVVDKLIELCATDESLLSAIMLPHKSYDKAFQYFYQQSRNVGYKMPHGNMVYLDNDKAVELSVEYFKRDDAAEEKKKSQKKESLKQQAKVSPKAKKKTDTKPDLKTDTEKPKQEVKQKKKYMDGQLSLFDF